MFKYYFSYQYILIPEEASEEEEEKDEMSDDCDDGDNDETDENPQPEMNKYILVSMEEDLIYEFFTFPPCNGQSFYLSVHLRFQYLFFFRRKMYQKMQK